MGVGADGRKVTAGAGYRLVKVRWLDSSGIGGGWHDFGDLTHESLDCETVGWLIHECPDCITVVPTIAVNEMDHGLQGVRIPSAVVKSIVNLVAAEVP